jgi:CubicO group peptidase (beta-lactamase class C family)
MKSLMRNSRISLWILLITCRLLLSGPLQADSAGAAHELTAQDVGTFLDGLLPMQLEREDIAGAVVVIVKDGTVLYSGGYGYSDVAKKKPVSVENTLFRPGSISKLFTWTSVMQLLEQRKVDLDRDVSTYIDFQIPATYSKPITLRNIMTHTPGFEETGKDLFVNNARDVTPLGVYLKNHIPDRIFPPGSVPAYSNYATALAGYVVQRVSGKPFDKYVEDSIFKPLGMTHSTFEQPLPEKIRSLMSNGYKLGSDDPKSFEFANPYPAGSLSATGSDMARFMIAHLQDGGYEDRQILRPETARLMHARQLTWDEAQPGMALGFYEESSHGLRIIGHGGDTIYFHSDLHLIPEKNIGFFISYNSAGKGEISGRTAVWQKLLDRYFPYVPPAATTVSTAAQDAKNVSGLYLISRRTQSDILHLLWRLQEMAVSARKDGTIEIDQLKDFNGKPKRWREVKPFIFREINGADLVVFKPRPDNSSLRLITRFPVFVFDKVSWYENSRFLLALAGFSLSVLLLTLILWPIASFIRRHYRKRLDLSSNERRLRWAVRIICAVDLIFITGFLVFLMQADKNIAIFSFRADPWLHLLQVVGAIGCLGTFLAIYSAYFSWSNPGHGKWRKIQHTVVALACIGFTWFVLQNHLLDFSLRY